MIQRNKKAAPGDALIVFIRVRDVVRRTNYQWCIGVSGEISGEELDELVVDLVSSYVS